MTSLLRHASVVAGGLVRCPAYRYRMSIEGRTVGRGTIEVRDEIRMLGVAPNAQGRGAGTALVRECVARAGGSRRVVLSTQTVAHGSHRLYERLGFVREPARDWAPVPGVALLCYVLEL